MKNPKNPATSILRCRLAIKLLTLAVGLAMPAATGWAQTLWQGGTSDYNNPASWNGIFNDPSNPNCSNDSGSNNVVLIEPGDPIWQHGDTLAGNGNNTSGAYLQTGSTNNTGGGNWLRMAVGSGTFGSYVLSNGVVNVGGETHIGETGVGYLEVDGGTFNDGGDPFAVGDGDFGSSPVGYMVMNGGTVNDSQELWIGEGNSTRIGTGYLTMNGGTLNISSWFDIGRWGGIGYLTMTGGTINKIGGGNTQWAAFNNGGSAATINMTGGTMNFQSGVVQLAAGGNGTVGTTCVFNQSGGTVHASSEWQIATDNAMAVATNNISGNAVLIADSWLAVGRNAGIGTLNLSGNAVISKTGVVAGNEMTIAGDGGSSPSIGVFNQTGGTLSNTATATWIGETGLATWNMSAGTAMMGIVEMCVNSEATAILNLNGGLFQCSGIYSIQSGAVSELNLNGATLQANANNTNFIGGLFQATIGPGSVIDSQGYNIAIPQALLDNGNGTLTKNGTGTLTLLGANSYAGATVVNAGTLLTGTSSSASASTGYTVADNAGFGVIVQSAGAQFSGSSLSLGVSTGASLDFNLGSFGNPTSAPLNLTALTANGTITVNVAAAVITTGLIPLAQFSTRSGSPTYVLGSLPAGVIANLVTTSTSISLNVTSAGLPRWNGNVTGMWDLGTNQDWIDLGTLLPTTYSDGKPVVFDDNATGTTTVDLTATVSPASINFNNNVLPYSIVGPGEISGNIGLNLNGTTNVSILNTGGNNFTGPVVINAGVLTVTNLANGGSPSAIGASSASPTNLVIYAGTFQYSGPAVTANRGFTVGATNSTIDAEGNLALGGMVIAAPPVIGGSSAFEKIGPAQLTLTGSNHNEFATVYDPGVLVVAGTLMMDGSAGNQTNHTVNEFWVGGTPATGASLILTNTTLNVDSWLGLGRGNGTINNTSTVTLYNSAASFGNVSLGYANGIAGNLAEQFLTLNGSSTLTDSGIFNLSESGGSTATLSVGGSSAINCSGYFDVALGGGSTAYMNVGMSNQPGGTVTVQNDMALGDQGTAVLNMVSGGKLTVTGTIYLSRNSATADGTINLNSGGTIVAGYVNNGWGFGHGISNNPNAFNFNGGTLRAYVGSPYFIQPYVNAVVQAGGAIIDDGGFTIDVLAPLVNGGGGGGLTKVGNGTLHLDGQNTYTGTTLVSSGTLGMAPNATIAGPVTVAAGATLAGDIGSIESFYINNSLTLQPGSTTTMTLTPSSNDEIQGLTSVTYGGALVVTNTSGSPLVVGHEYILFNAANSGTGNFSSITILPSGAGTFNPANGVLTITPSGGFTFSSLKTSAGSLVMVGSGGTPSSGYTLLSSTNLATPISAWITNTTGTLDASGNLSNSIPLNPAQPAVFFRLRQP
jgi:autotransporter-associated beta strand protein